MTPKQALFVKEYLVDLNAAQAAIRAGYSSKTSAWRLLRHREVAAAVAAAKAERSAKLDRLAERVILEFVRIAFADISDYAEVGPDGVAIRDIAGLTPDQTAAIAEVTENRTTRGATIRFKLHDKLGALNALARHLDLSPIANPPPTQAENPDVREIARQIAFALRRGAPTAADAPG